MDSSGRGGNSDDWDAKRGANCAWAGAGTGMREQLCCAVGFVAVQPMLHESSGMSGVLRGEFSGESEVHCVLQRGMADVASAASAGEISVVQGRPERARGRKSNRAWRWSVETSSMEGEAQAIREDAS